MAKAKRRGATTKKTTAKAAESIPGKAEFVRSRMPAPGGKARRAWITQLVAEWAEAHQTDPKPLTRKWVSAIVSTTRAAAKKAARASRKPVSASDASEATSAPKVERRAVERRSGDDTEAQFRRLAKRIALDRGFGHVDALVRACRAELETMV